MKTLLTDFLICPTCLPEENVLKCDVKGKHGEDILSANLVCGECGARYIVDQGIPFLLPKCNQDARKGPSRYESPSLVSSYLWSHYADIFGDIDAGTAYAEWAALIEYSPGFFLDAGCAVGRFTFEMSNKSDFAIGVDKSCLFIQKARELMSSRKLKFSLPEEGMIMESRTIELPVTCESNKVDFMVADVQFLPFRSGIFSSLSSLNLLDKIPLPFVHLKEMNRVAQNRNAQFLFSDPFSWSSDIAKEEDWLGGVTAGPYQGRGIDNVIQLLSGERQGVFPPWKIDREGQVWWKLRNHRNHFELIHSCFVKACR